MQFWTLDEIEQHAMADHEVGEEISPGVTVTRRRILQLGLAGAAGLLVGGPALGRVRGALDDDPDSPLRIHQLMAELWPRAKELIGADRPDEAAYLAAVTRLLTRYTPIEPWWMGPPNENGFAMHPAARMPPVVVFDIHMQPGATIHLHDHRHYNGVLLCNEGSYRCRNFDIVQPDGRGLDVAAGEVPPVGEDFLIRQNADKTLVPGEFSTLSRDRDNIHHVEAGPDGCKLTDVFTHFRPEARSHRIEWDDQPLEKRGDVYRVAWRT
ncbi:MAG: hypothetical protein AAGI17_07320 [Planctomycetota bacterium]